MGEVGQPQLLRVQSLPVQAGELNQQGKGLVQRTEFSILSTEYRVLSTEY